MFKKPAMNKTADSITELTIYLRSVRKWGKSSLARDIIRAKYNGDMSYGCMVECGLETGDTMLNMNMCHLDTYQDFMDFKDWLINEKGKEHHIELVSFDTIDELVPIFEAEVLHQYNRENPTKKVKSIKAAYGGFNTAVNMTADMIKRYMAEIKKAGFGVLAISHSRFKQIREKGSTEEEGYMVLSSSLGSSYESAFSDIFDVILTGTIDRKFDEKNDKKYTTDSTRRLYFRGTNLIEAGSRFATGSVPEYLQYDNDMDSLDFAKLFIKTVEDGLAKSKLDLTSTPTSKIPQTKIPVALTAPEEKSEEPEEIPTIQPTPADVEEAETTANAEPETDDVFSDTTNDVEELRATIKETVKTVSADKKAEAVKFIKENGGKVDALGETECLKVLEILS